MLTKHASNNYIPQVRRCEIYKKSKVSMDSVENVVLQSLQDFSYKFAC